MDSKHLSGSIKRKIVNPDLLEERAKKGIEVDELVRFVIGEDMYEKNKEALELFKKYPELRTQPEELEMTREELLGSYWKKIKLTNEVAGEWFSQGTGMTNNFTNWGGKMIDMAPLTLHRGVFTNTLTLLGSPE